MSDKEINLISSYLDSKYTMLEYGSGGSTIFFSKIVRQYVSIEYDLKWYKKITDLIKIENCKNIKYVYCPPDNPIKLPIGTSQSNSKDFINYVNCIDSLSYTKYDAVLIDGRARVNCSIKILDYIDKNSIIFIHDFFTRPKYNKVFQNYKLIDSIEEGQSLGVFRKII